MNGEENKSIVRALWSAIAANDEDELRAALAPELQVYNPLGSEPQNRDVHIQTLLQWNRTFSASRFEIEAQICERNTVVTRGLMRAIHRESKARRSRTKGERSHDERATESRAIALFQCLPM